MTDEVTGVPPDKQVPETLDVLRKVHITRVLGLVCGDETEAARLLDITPGELHRLMRQLDIPNPADKGNAL